MEREQKTAVSPPQEFFPRGAIAFFFAMIGFYLVLWLTMYWVMAGRS